MSTGLITILILAALAVVALLTFRRRKATDTDGRYLIKRPGIAGLHCHPSIPRATAEGMADLLAEVYRETWPVVRDNYADACRERGRPVSLGLPRWHTTRLEPGQMSDGRWTAYGVSSGIWTLSVGCAPALMAEEIHSVMRAYLGNDVYRDHRLYTVEGVTVSGWIRERYEAM
jgi:hypothetical protein